MTSEVDVQPAPQADPAEERIGQVLAEKYALRRVIGRGGMGVVYAAIHQWTSREVAVKTIRAQLAESGELSVNLDLLGRRRG